MRDMEYIFMSEEEQEECMYQEYIDACKEKCYSEKKAIRILMDKAYELPVLKKEVARLKEILQNKEAIIEFMSDELFTTRNRCDC